MVFGLLRALLLNVVPIWGFTQDQWTAGTILVLFWLQTVATIPVTALLIVLHRKATHKAGHYRGMTFLSEFLMMSVPFAIGHGIFLAVVLGLVWKDAAGAVDLQDVRLGAIALLVVLGVGFVSELPWLRERSFAWLQTRTTTVIQRTGLVHFVIIFGMAAAAFADGDPEVFFAVFLGLKLLFDVLSELPQWNPSGEMAPWFARLLNRIAARPGVDSAAEWKKAVQQQRRDAELAERPIESLDAADKPAR